MALFGRRSESREVAVRQVRDPTAATRSLRWTTPGRSQPPDWDAARAFEVAYYQNIAVYACFQAIAATISSLPFRVGPDPDKPDDYDVTAPLAKLLGPPPGGPNPGMSAEEWWFYLVVQYLTTGRLGAEIETDGMDKPIALWPLVSSSLVPIPSTSGTAWFTAYEYGRLSDKRRLPTDRVFYAWQPRGNDFRQPESALEAAALDVSIAVMQSRYDYAFLKNDSRPAAIVVTEEFEDQDSSQAFKDQWNSSYGGPNNSGKTAFIETEPNANGVKGAIDVQILGISPKDAQAAQRYASRLQQIAIGLGVPWSRLDASGRTFDNASQEDLIWWDQRLRPLCRRLQSAVNIQLAPRLGNLVGWFDLRGVRALQTRPEPLTAKVGAPSMVQAQLMWINEARADYGLPSIPNGDRMMTPDEIAALSGAAGPPAVVRMLEELEERITAKIEVRAEPAPLPAIATPPALVEVDHEARRSKLWTTTNGKIRNLERQWERALRKLFARQQRSVLARLEAKRGRSVHRTGEVRALADEVFDPFHWASETEDDVSALYEAVTAAGGARVSDLFGLAFDLEAPYAQEFVKARANQLAGQVTQSTYDAIQSAMADGIAEGESIPQLAERIRHVFDVASKTRSVTIARTEVISAFNGSASLTAAEYGTDVVAGQEWITAIDSRTRDSHAEVNGEIVNIGEVFSNGLAYPGDPSGDAGEVVNCRCTIAMLTPEDMDAMSGGRSRLVDRRIAHAVLMMIRPGADVDERWVRQALRTAA